MALDIKAEAERLRTMYLEDPRQQSFNALLLGEMGAGKTFILRTARRPIHIDLFDPGGAKCLQDLIRTGDVVIGDYTNEDPKKPNQFSNWKRDFEERERSGYFAQFGTYCIDSATTFSETIMNSVLKAAGIAGKAPRFTHDYIPVKVELKNWLWRAFQLPCDFILTGHLAIQKDITDDGKETIKFRFMTTGQGMVTIPLLFDEVYIAVTKESSKGLSYHLLTKSTGAHLARTRIGGDKFATLEEPDIKALLKKAGYPCEDKPRLF